MPGTMNPVKGRPRKSYLTRRQELLAERDREIRKLREEGLTMPAIAKKFGLTKQRVEQILKHRKTRSGAPADKSWQYRCFAWREHGKSSRWIASKVGVPLEDVCALFGIAVPPLPPGKEEG